MNTAEALRRIDSVTSPIAMPIQARNKSWLFVFMDADRELQFYDARHSPRDAFDRILRAQPRHELLDVLAFTSADEAKKVAVELQQARTLLNYYSSMMPPAPPAAAAANPPPTT
jgi:hypothetical protein